MSSQERPIDVQTLQFLCREFEYLEKTIDQKDGWIHRAVSLYLSFMTLLVSAFYLVSKMAHRGSFENTLGFRQVVEGNYFFFSMISFILFYVGGVIFVALVAIGNAKTRCYRSMNLIRRRCGCEEGKSVSGLPIDGAVPRENHYWFVPMSFSALVSIWPSCFVFFSPPLAPNLTFINAGLSAMTYVVMMVFFLKVYQRIKDRYKEEKRGELEPTDQIEK